MSDFYCNIILYLSAFVFAGGLVRIFQANHVWDLTCNWIRNYEYETKLYRLYGQ